MKRLENGQSQEADGQPQEADGQPQEADGQSQEADGLSQEADGQSQEAHGIYLVIGPAGHTDMDQKNGTVREEPG